MCMGLGCNAAGVTGCRIIDSPRERLIAILTNSFVPCNGRFPTMISLIAMFFVGAGGGWGRSLLGALLLTGVVVLGIGGTLLVSWLLSKTLLRGVPSSFTLEMPPFRPPQVGQVLLRSILDRTLFVLGRAAAVAAPAGLVIWCLANAIEVQNNYGDIKLSKKHKDDTERIDPVAAVMNALARALVHRNQNDLSAAIGSGEFTL